MSAWEFAWLRARRYADTPIRRHRILPTRKEFEDEDDDEDEDDLGGCRRTTTIRRGDDLGRNQSLRMGGSSVSKRPTKRVSIDTVLGRRQSKDVAQKVGGPCDESEFDLINVEFFVIKKGLH
jgi:hypothetical protein